MTPERMFPIMSSETSKPHPMSIPWSVAELAFSVYYKHHKSQSLERIAERGGFYAQEMDGFLPDWRERCSAFEAQAAELARVKAEHQVLLDQQQEEIEGLLQQVAQLQGERDVLLTFTREGPPTRPEQAVYADALARMTADRDRLRVALEEVKRHLHEILHGPACRPWKDGDISTPQLYERVKQVLAPAGEG